MIPIVLTLLSTVSGCSIVLLDNPCDTGPLGDTAQDTGFAPESRFIDAGTGGGHTCGILAGGSIECWGINDDGQLNAPSGVFSSIHVGHAHACALDDLGEVQCWGRNNQEQTALSGAFSTVVAGGAHTCGLRESGEVECVGSNEYGQSSPPEALFLSISAGATHTCGVTADRTGQQSRVCWGAVEHASTEGLIHESSISGTDWACFEAVDKEGTTTYPCIGESDEGQHDIPSSLKTATWAAGARHGCGLTNDDTVVCWGSNDAGQASAPAGRYIRVISGSTSLHTCAFEKSSDADQPGWLMDCWGLDAENQLAP